MAVIVKDLETVLKEANIITQENIENYLGIPAPQRPSLFEYVNETLKIDQDTLANAFSTVLKLERITALEEDNINVSMLGKIPLKFLKDNYLFPCIIKNEISLLTANPCNFKPIDNIRLVIGQYKLYIATRLLIIDSISRYYPMEGAKKVMEELEAEGETTQTIDYNTISEEDVLGIAQEAPVIKLVNNILFNAVKKGASDIHIEPFEKELRVRYRIDGNLYTIMNPPKKIHGALASRIKIMSQLNIAEKRQPQDGRIQIKVVNKAIDIRVSILPIVYGEQIVMRLLDKTKSFIAIEDLGLSDRDLLVTKDAITEPNGIILVTGPTGSGKTSTLYAILYRLNVQDTCIITVEDPVEYQMMGIGQVQVREKVGLTFAAALRSILRQDPDIIMIGETRDQETAQIAIQAALTGHLVLSTLHTNSAAASVTRLIDMGIEPFLIASSLSIVIAQRLVRRLCTNCKVPYFPTPEELRRLPNGGKALEGKELFKAKGCSQCLNTGYRGRLPIFEIMKMSQLLIKLTLERADASKIEEASVKEGMTTLVEDGIRKVLLGMTTISEVLSVASSHE